MDNKKDSIRSSARREAIRSCMEQRRQGFAAGLAGNADAGAATELAYVTALLWLKGFARGTARREANLSGGDPGSFAWLNTASTAECSGYLQGVDGTDGEAELYAHQFGTLSHWIAGFTDGSREHEARRTLEQEPTGPSPG